MKGIFAKLYKAKLERTPSMLFTLGAEELDKAFVLDQSKATLTPDKESILNFSAATYLLGLLGYQVVNFTAVPAGFLATYENNGESATLLVGKKSLELYREVFCELIEKHIGNINISEEEATFFGHLNQCIKENNDFVETCLVANYVLDTSKGLAELKDRKNVLSNPFNPSTAENEELSVNERNCRDNHVIMEQIARELLGYPVEDEKMSEEQKEKAKNLAGEILETHVLPSYLTYVGHDRQNNPIERDSQILNRLEKVKTILNVVKTPERMALVLNMCSTDYAADVVYAVLKEMTSCKNVERSAEEIDKLVPETPHNAEQKEFARAVVKRMTEFSNSGIEKK